MKPRKRQLHTSLYRPKGPGSNRHSLSAIALATSLLASCSFGDGPELIMAESSDDTVGAETSSANDDNAAAVNADETMAVTGESPSNDGNESEPETQDSEPEANSDAMELGDSTEVTDDSNTDIDADAETTEDADITSDSPGAGDEPMVRIPRTDANNVPKIDGATLDYLPGTQLLGGEWQFAAQFNALGEPLGVNNFMFNEEGGEPDAESDTHHHWAALHDGVYLYLVVVSDDAGNHFQDSNELRKPWKDDSVEIYFDGNNSRLTGYDGLDDFHMTINLLSTPEQLNSSYVEVPLIRQSESSAILPSDLIFSTGPNKGPMSANTERGRKDIYEIRIKLSELNIEIESPFGIEVQLNDDDDGGTRDTKWGWNHPEGTESTNDFTWRNPTFMGSAILLR